MTDNASPTLSPPPGEGEPATPTWQQPPGQLSERKPRDPVGPEELAVIDATRVGAPVQPAITENVTLNDSSAAPGGENPDEREVFRDAATTKVARTAPARACLECGGPVDADGYCTTCGAKAPSERDHFEEIPAPWVGAVCDRGLRHPRNEDALATSADAAPGSCAVLVVCDGVTNSEGSDVAALAAARAARDALTAGSLAATATPASRRASMTALFAHAAALAQDAVVAATAPDSTDPAACTLVAAVVTPGVVYAAGVGDSRVYWLGDAPGDVALLTRDDSIAADDIAAGVPRKQAEESAQAHTITRWLGVDARDVVPRVSSMNVTGPGWVLVCSDGLWNYASEPAALKEALDEAVAGVGAAIPAPVAVASGLVKWANAQGGHDNISAALARIVPALAVGADGPDGHSATEPAASASPGSPQSGGPSSTPTL